MMQCGTCGRYTRRYTAVQTNYGLSRAPRKVIVCADCSALAEADEAPRRLRGQIDQIVTLDAAAAQAGMPVKRRDELFRSGEHAAVFEAMLTEVR